MNRLYAEDLTGGNPDNVATGQLSTTTYPNKFNLVIPPAAPFYRNGMEITDLNGNPLFEGIDYYLALYYADGAEASRAAIFGGIMLLNHTEVKYKVQAFGSAYSVPETEIGLFLVNQQLTEPRNLDWSALLRWKIPVPEMGAPENFEEAIATDKVIAAVMQLRDLIGDNGEKLDAVLEDVVTELANVAVRIHNDDLYQHHKTPHEHKYTKELVGALGKNAAAVNAVKIFGRTIQELSNIFLQSHVSQFVIDRLYDKAGGALNGRLHVSGTGELSFVSSSGKQAFRANGQNITIATDTGTLKFVADSAKNNRGAAVELSAGYNSLLIPSDGAGNTLRPLYNGAFVITENTVNLYLWAPVQSIANPTFNSTETLRSSGVATEGSPWTLEALLPQATATKKGLFRLTSSFLLTSPGYAITQKAVTELRDRLDAYVNESFTVNNKAFGTGQSVTLTRADIGLGNVDNTAAKDKPVHQRFRDALLNKALKTHTHAAADLQNIPTASATVSGLTYLANTLDYTSYRAAIPKLLYDLSLDIDAGEDAANNIIPGWVANGTFYGDYGFLPIPTAGRYDGSSQQMDSTYRAAIARAENGKMYVLRNATSGYPGSEMVLYWTADVNEAGAISKPVPTTVEYVPAGLKTLAPNVKFKMTTVIGDDCAIFMGTDNNYYLVMFNGTMDMAKHTRVSRVTLENLDVGTVDPIVPSYFNTNEDRLVLTNGKVCLIKMYLQQTDFYTAIWTLNESLVGKNADVVMSKVPLTGKHPAGDAARFATYGSNSNDPNTTNFWYITPEGAAKWTSRNLVTFSRRNIYAAAKGNKIRVRIHARSSLQSQGIRNSDPQWTVSYVIDLDAKTAVLDDDFFPLCVDETGVAWLKGKYEQTSNNLFYGYTMCLFVQGDIVTGVGNSDAEDFMVRYRLPSDDAFESARWNADWTPGVGGSLNVLGPYASAYILRMRGLAALGGPTKKVLLRQRSTGSCMSVAYDTDTTYGVPGYDGWGPSNDREVVSQNDYEAICRLGQVYDGTQTYLNGASFRKAESRAYKNVPGTTTITSDRVAISDQQWTDIQNFLGNKIPEWSGIDATMKASWLSVFDLGGQNLCVLQACMLTPNASAGGFDNSTFFYRIPMTFANGLITLTLASGVEVWKDVNFRVSAVSINDLAEMSQMRLIKRSDGWILRTRTLCRVNTSSSSTDLSYLIKISQDLATWTAARITFNPSNTEIDYVYLQETDEIARLTFVMNGIYLGGTAYGGKGIAFETGAKQVVLTGPQVAEGVILYITQSIFFFANAKEYSVPAATFDFKQLFPTNYQNNTFHFHVYLDGNTPKYKVGLTREADTATQLYIGYAKTGNTSILDTNIQRATRLDNVSALNQHIANKFAHDYLMSGNTAQTVYSLMKNLGQINDKTLVPVPDAQELFNFNSFSHQATVQTQPASAADAAAWEFKSPDSFECTANTSSFTGRLSTYQTGDYDLAFLVTGAETDAYKDNDSGAIVIAAFAKGDIDGREHTLSVVFGLSTETHLKLTGVVELIEDYQTPWQRSIAVINPKSDPYGASWSPYALLVRVSRRGTKYDVLTHMADVGPGDRSEVIRGIRRNLSELVNFGYTSGIAVQKYSFDAAAVAPTFATDKTRWGFGAYSQQYMRFWPMQVPLPADVGYATTKLMKERYAPTALIEPIVSVSLSSITNASVEATWSSNGSGYPLWPVVAEYATGTSNAIGGGAAANTRAIMPPSNAAASKALRFVTAKSFTVPAGITSGTLSGYVDDGAEVYVNGVSQGAVGARISKTITLLPGQTNTIGFIVSEAPDLTPCYIGYSLSLSNGTMAVQSLLTDTYAWMAADGQVLAPEQATALVTQYLQKSTYDTVHLLTSNVARETGEYCTPRKTSEPMPLGDGEQRAVFMPVSTTVGFRDIAMVMPKITNR